MKFSYAILRLQRTKRNITETDVKELMIKIYFTRKRAIFEEIRACLSLH